jgi:hypothetical protein
MTPADVFRWGSEPADEGHVDALEHIEAGGLRLATILRSNFSAEGIVFLTPDEYSQQLGYMARPAGYFIGAHSHNVVDRTVSLTQEVLFVRSGRVRVDLFDSGRQHVATRVLEPLDVILLSGGGHSFEILEDAELIEVKQGPFVGEHDKTRFDVELPPLDGPIDA